MVDMFGRCSERGLSLLQEAVEQGQAVEMENYFSRLTLDIIGKAVFNYEFDSLRHDDPFIQVLTRLLPTSKTVFAAAAAPKHYVKSCSCANTTCAAA